MGDSSDWATARRTPVAAWSPRSGPARPGASRWPGRCGAPTRPPTGASPANGSSVAKGRTVLAALLRHEAKTTTYKFALVRALNDLALEHPLDVTGDVVVPLRRVAERWLVFYWPFVGAQAVDQGARAWRGGARRQDVSFRPELTGLRQAWEALPHTRPDPADGAVLLAVVWDELVPCPPAAAHNARTRAGPARSPGSPPITGGPTPRRGRRVRAARGDRRHPARGGRVRRRAGRVLARSRA